MGSLSFRRKWIIAKRESTYGVAPAMVGGDAVLTKNLNIVQYQGNTVGRDIDKSTYGNDPVINTGPNVQVRFDVELAGSAAAGTAPPWSDVLRACGMIETINAAVSVIYTPRNTGTFDSVAFNFYHAGNKQVITGCRGNVQFVMERGQIPVMRFSFIGLYSRPVTAAEVASVVSDYRAPVPVTNANTSVYTLFGFAPNSEGITIDLGNSVAYRNLIGNEEVIITDRRSTFSTTVEAQDIADNDYFLDVESHAGSLIGALALTHGNTPDRFAFAADAIQYTAMQMGESDGLATYQLDGVITAGGSNEFSMTLS